MALKLSEEIALSRTSLATTLDRTEHRAISTHGRIALRIRKLKREMERLQKMVEYHEDKDRAQTHS